MELSKEIMELIFELEYIIGSKCKYGFNKLP